MAKFKDMCDECDGEGGFPLPDGDFDLCMRCKGSGKKKPAGEKKPREASEQLYTLGYRDGFSDARESTGEATEGNEEWRYWLEALSGDAGE